MKFSKEQLKVEYSSPSHLIRRRRSAKYKMLRKQRPVEGDTNCGVVVDCIRVCLLARQHYLVACGQYGSRELKEEDRYDGHRQQDEKTSRQSIPKCKPSKR